MRDAILWMIVSYLIGSIPTGYLVTRLVKGEDIRTVGSGGTGATNVRRSVGKGWAVFVALIDMVKGAVAILVTATSSTAAPELLSLAGFAAVFGHNYPLWLKFEGGKGIATTYGVIFFLKPYESFAVALLSGAIWYAVMKVTRYVSIASMISLLAVPLFFWILEVPFPFILVSSVLAGLSIYRHKSNIVRLSQGRENKV